MERFNFKPSDTISETLLICLYAKSEETKCKNPLIIDKTAVELVRKIDYDFSKFKNKRSSSVGNSLRAVHLDNMTKRFISERSHPIVVVVGCGLDSRPQRIGEKGNNAIFYELDLPDVIKIRKELIPPQENEVLISSSMLETNWLDKLLSAYPNGDFIFIIEGVLMYFDEKDNRFLITEIAKRFKNSEIHFDLPNKWMSQNSAKHGTISKTNAKFKFGIDDPKEIEKWNPNLKFVKSYRYADLKGYRRMGFMSYLMDLFPNLKNSFRIIFYKTK